MRRTTVAQIAACFLSLAAMLSAMAEEVPQFPTRIVMTDADLQEIQQKGTLRGREVRPLLRRVKGDSLVWEGLRVFTGKKSDIIGWFKTFPMLDAQKMMGGEQYSGACNLRNYQYDLLCSALLQSGDIDIRRAVIWNYRGFRSNYLFPDWAQAAHDPALSLKDRLLADLLSRSEDFKGWPEVFWKEYAPNLTT